MKEIDIKNKLLFAVNIIVMFFTSTISVFASGYLYNSNEVSYNNTASGISSNNVQGAIDSLYASANNYSSINTRVTTLEDMTHITSNKVEGLELNKTGALSSYGGYVDFHYAGSSSDYTSRISETSNGKLDIVASNGVTLNGKAMPLYKIVYYDDGKSRTINAHTAYNASTDWTVPSETGYTFKGILGGYGNGNTGLVVSPNRWLYNSHSANNTYSYVTWILLYERNT